MQAHTPIYKYIYMCVYICVCVCVCETFVNKLLPVDKLRTTCFEKNAKVLDGKMAELVWKNIL